MAVVQMGGFEHGLQQWQGVQPVFVDPSMSCGAQAMSMQMPQMLAMQQGMVMVPVMMVPVFVPSMPEPQPSSPSNSSVSCSGASAATFPSEGSATPSNSSRMQHVADRFSLMACRAYGASRNEQVAENIASLAANGLQLCFPDLGFSRRGSQEVRSFFIDFLNRVPDLKLTLLGITEDGPRHGGMEYLISGTQTEAFLPMFPVGKWVEWKFSSRYEFDRDSRIRVHEIRFDFPSDDGATPEHFEGLAQCLYLLSSSSGGSRLLQKALDYSASEAGKAVLLEAMSYSVWDMSLSPHGNHVVQKCITSLFPHQVQFIVDAFRGKVAQAARNQMQSRILERILENCPAKQTEQLVEEALRQAAALLMDPFGNFVMQAILEHGSDGQRSRLVAVICQDVHRFSRDGISSNSVRKALMHSDAADQSALIAAIKADPDRFLSLSKHQTGSFVVRELKRIARILSSQ